MSFRKFVPTEPYPLHRLQEFNLAYAKEGHPIASATGNRVDFLLEADRVDCYLVICHCYVPNFPERLGTDIISTAYLPIYLKLAPLSGRYKRGLHIGDTVEIFNKTLRIWEEYVLDIKTALGKDWNDATFTWRYKDSGND
jgi:hypothetical protein